jgi:branched-chain amino acid transport system permease protein
MLDAIVQGVLLGGYYAILAAGLSLMFGVVRFINLAHGDLALLGAYLVLFAVERLGLPVWLATLAALPVMAAIGWLLQAAVFSRTLKAGILLPLLATFGLGAVLQNGMLGIFGSDTKSLGNHIGNLSWSSWQVPFDISIGKLPALTLAVAVLVLGGLHLLLKRTPIGRAIRATATDPEAAELCGVTAARVYRVAAAVALALAGLAGTLLAMRALISPYSGPTQLIFAFEAVVIGGIGSLWGTLVGGIVLGIAQSVGSWLSPQYFQIGGHLVFLAVLGARLWRAHLGEHGGWRAAIAGMR